jgi:FkbM family methyltransferase
MFFYLIKKGNQTLEQTLDFLKSNKKPLVLFGAGTAGETMLTELSKLDICVSCFGDNDAGKQHTKFYGLDVLSPGELAEKYKGAVVIVSIGGPAASAVEQQLKAYGCFERIIDNFYCPSEFYDYEKYVRFNANAFEIVYDFLADDKSRDVLVARLNGMISNNTVFPAHLVDSEQYFDKDIVRFKQGEVFLDAGSFEGETAIEFAGIAPDYKKIICMEPEKGNFDVLLKNTVALERTEHYRLGAWSCKASFHFKSSGFASRISDDDGNETIEVASIDEMFSNEEITFIKMDIEGAEIQALKGARETIKRCKPRMAVCVYHKREDMLAIPFLLKSINSDYNIYFRHYGPSVYETVCYAV